MAALDWGGAGTADKADAAGDGGVIKCISSPALDCCVVGTAAGLEAESDEACRCSGVLPTTADGIGLLVAIARAADSWSKPEGE